MNETYKEYRRKKQEFIENYKTPCVRCGCDKKCVIDLHHIDSSTKAKDISRCAKEYGWDRLKEELQKCISLCSNCHREFHFLYGQDTNAQDLEKFLNS